MFYEMVLTMQLVHLTCRKGPVQPPTRKGGWDLFQRTSDENSIFTPINMNMKLPRSETPWRKKELHRAVDPPQRMKTTMGTRDNSRWRKECYERSYDQRITVDHGEWCIWSASRHKMKYVISSIWIYKNKCTKQGSLFSSERIDYDMTYSIDQYISSIEPPVQNEEGRWYSTSRGVTTENYI